jgi:hypothetical protein
MTWQAIVAAGPGSDMLASDFELDPRTVNCLAAQLGLPRTCCLHYSAVVTCIAAEAGLVSAFLCNWAGIQKYFGDGH